MEAAEMSLKFMVGLSLVVAYLLIVRMCNPRELNQKRSNMFIGGVLCLFGVYQLGATIVWLGAIYRSFQ